MGIVTLVFLKLGRGAAGSFEPIRCRCPSNPIALPLADAFLHSEKLGGVHVERRSAAGKQPKTLPRKDHEQQAGQDLRLPEAVAGEKISHGTDARVFYHFSRRLGNSHARNQTRSGGE